MIPEISRRKSLLSQDLSEQILAQAYYELFRSFKQIIDFYEKCYTHGSLLTKEVIDDYSEISKALDKKIPSDLKENDGSQ